MMNRRQKNIASTSSASSRPPILPHVPLSTHSLSRVVVEIGYEIQAWIDRETLHRLSASLRNPNINNNDLVALLTQFHDRVSQGFNRELQDLAGLVVAALIRFNKEVFVRESLLRAAWQELEIEVGLPEGVLNIVHQTHVHVSVCVNLKLALKGINRVLESRGVAGKLDFRGWREELNEQKRRFPLSYKTFEKEISPRYAVQVLDELTNGEAIVSTGVGQHQMWAAQFYKYKRPRQWLTSGGLGAMGKLSLKILLLNNQHLGMVVQWEDRFYKSNRAHTYLGDPSNENAIYPNMLKFADAYGIPAARVTKKEDLRAAIQKMLETPGPYLLDVIVPQSPSRACLAHDS
ncbi:Acetolactate synthase 1, chloroplastic isoform A [Glycine soja]|uniref:Acetolactate synthase 1, chloroplastic isoform A n=1 Tax=Glycine soja TaxID=3848 RepID=A0A445LZX3_GLYSO|nr:Acetolactate synthase 1, chloroplastic isoform A [Glycine soja]